MYREGLHCVSSR